MSLVVKEIVDESGRRKVELFRRDDGTYGFEDLRYYKDQYEDGWSPHGRYSQCFAATLEIAEREARGRVDWLRGTGNDG